MNVQNYYMTSYLLYCADVRWSSSVSLSNLAVSLTADLCLFVAAETAREQLTNLKS